MQETGEALQEAPYFDAHVRDRLGEAVRCQYKLAGPLPDRLYDVLQEAERRAGARAHGHRLGALAAALTGASERWPASMLAVALGKVCERYRMYLLPVFVVDPHGPG
jgi:hypothetical protein